jgi:hypothetical protein
MNHIFFKSSLLFSLSFSLFAQIGEPANLDHSSLLDLPVGTIVTIDGKGLSKVQRECPNKNKVKYLINGKEQIEISNADLIFSDGDVTCSGGTDLALIYSDIAGRRVTFKGKVQDRSPLRCAVKEVVEFEGSIAVYLDSPCSLGVFFKRSLLDFRSVKDLTIKSFKHNLGKHVSFDLDHSHKPPANVSSDKSNDKDSISENLDSSTSESRGVEQ